MPEAHPEQSEHVSEQAASIGAAAALRPFLAALRRHWLLILALTVISGGGCIAWFQRKDPTYEAQAQILVTPLPEDSSAFVGLPILRSSDDPARLIGTAADIIASPEAAERAAEELEGFDRAAVEDKVDVAADEVSNIVGVTASSTDREEAAALANAYAEGSLEARGEALVPLFDEAIKEKRQQIETLLAAEDPVSEGTRASLSQLLVARAAGMDPTLSLTQVAVAPGKPIGLPRWVLILIAFVGGFAIGCLAAVLIDLLTPRRLSNEEEITEILPAPVLTRIPEAGRGVPLGQVVAEIRESYRTLRGRLVYADSGRPGSEPAGLGLGSVAMISPGRGDGRTTSTLSLARAVAAGGDPVIAVDLDLRNPGLASVSAHEPQSDLGGALLGAEDPSAAIEPIGERISLMAAPRDAFGEMIERSAGRTRAIIAAALAHATTVIIDTPAFSEASDALSVVAEADHTVIVIRLGRTTAASLARLRESLEAAGVRPSGYALIGVGPSAAARALRGGERARQAAQRG